MDGTTYPRRYKIEEIFVATRGYQTISLDFPALLEVGVAVGHSHYNSDLPGSTSQVICEC
jgi:hypothetical protein